MKVLLWQQAHVRTWFFVAANALHRHGASLSCWCLLAFAAVIAAISTVSGVGELRHRTSNYENLRTQREEEVGRLQTQRLNGWEVEPALRVIRPPETVSGVVIGSISPVPRYWDFGPAGVRRGQPPGLEDTPTSASLDTVVRVLLGLLALLLAIDALSLERASGTLLGVLSQSVHPTVVLLGKLAGAGLALGFATVTVLGTVTVTLLIVAPDIVTADTIRSLGLLAVPAWLYATSCYSLALLILTSVKSHHLGITVSVLAWVLSGVMGIEVANLCARTISPAPPAYLTELTADRIAAEMIRAAQIQLGNELVSTSSIEGDDGVPPSDRSWTEPTVRRLRQRWVEAAEQVRAKLDHLNGEAEQSIHRQRQIAAWTSLASPGALFTTAAAGVAGTGPSHAAQWEEAVRGYQRQLNAALFDDRPRVILHVPISRERMAEATGRSIIAFNVRPPVTLASLPEFAPPDSGLAGRMTDMVRPLIGLMLYVLVPAAIASVTFRRAIV
jgi:hypothetical protein